MKKSILKRFLAACMAISTLTVSLVATIPMTASAASSSLTISSQSVSFPSTNYGTYSFKNFKEAATGIPLWCIEPELDRVTGTYTNKGALTQSVIDNTYWSHENGTVNNYGKPTANEIYSILWHTANTEGLNLNNLTAWQQGGIQMAIKHWRVRNQPWGVKATAGSDADKAFQLAKRLHAAVWANTKTMQTGRASIAASYTGGGYISGSNYIIGTYRISGNYDSYTVEKDTGCATAVVLTKSGNTVTASIPLPKMTETYQFYATLGTILTYGNL